MRPTSEDDEDARGRKRERDKQNQRRKRLRDKETIQELTRRNVSLERQIKAIHDGTQGDVRQLSNTVDLLRARNQALCKQLGRVDGLELRRAKEQSPENETVMSASEDPILPVDGSERHTGGLRNNTAMNDFYFGKVHVDFFDLYTRSTLSGAGTENSRQSVSKAWLESLSMDHSSKNASDAAVGRGFGYHQEPHILDQLSALSPSQSQEGQSEITVAVNTLHDMLALPAWQRLPLNLDAHKCVNPFSPIIRQMRDSPEDFKMCDVEPKALDLLFGGSQNKLANTIFEMTRLTPLRQPEKVAGARSSYLISRWLIEPSEESYNQIPSAFHPTARQLFVPHAPMIDYLMWPQLRDNFIKHGMKYCRGEVFGLLFCTCRIRNTPNYNFVVRNGGDDPHLDPIFLDRVSDPNSWVLLDKFWIEYPELVEGLDPERFMISEKDLI